MLARRSRLLTLAFVLLSLLAVRPAEAQRVADVFPEPLSGRDVDAIARLLDLSLSQRLAVDPSHERYLEDYRTLRADEMEPFLADIMRSWRGFMFNPDVEMVKDKLRTLERITNRMASIDQRFFDEMTGVLTDAQQLRMPRVRSRRERDRLASGMVRGIGFANPATLVDLTRMIENTPLEPGARSAVEPVLAGYEPKATAQRRQLSNTTTDVMIEVAEFVSGAIREAMASGDPSRLGSMFEDMQPTLLKMAVPVFESAGNLAELNRATFEDLEVVLDPVSRERLFHAYWDEAYDEIYDDVVARWDQVDAVLRLPDLDPGTRELVEALRTDMRSRTRAAGDRLIQFREQIMSDPAIMIAAFDDGEHPLIDRYDTLEESLEEMNDRFGENLTAMLGAETLARLDLPPDQGGPAPAPAAASAIEAMSMAAPMIREQPEIPGLEAPEPRLDTAAPLIASAITPRELAWYGMILQLDDIQVELLQSTHVSYLDTWDASVIPAIEAYEAQIAATSDAEVSPSDRATAARAIAGARAAARTAVEGADAEFFEELEMIVLDPGDPLETAALPRVVDARARVRANAGSPQGLGRMGRSMIRGSMTTGSREDRVDLSLVLHEMALPEGMLDAVLPELQSYERELTGMFAAFDDAWQSLADVSFEMAAAMAEDENRQRDGSFWQQMAEPNRALRSARMSIVEHNRAFIATLDSVLGADTVDVVVDRYHRTAFPEVYRDKGSAEGPLLAALRLPALGGNQERELQDLMTTFRPDYRAICEAIVAVRKSEVNLSEDWGQRWRQEAERRNRLDQLTFDRDELNARTLRRLRSILDDDQAYRVGFLVRQTG